MAHKQNPPPFNTDGRRIGRLSDPCMQPALEEMRRRIRDEEGFAKLLLQEAGILDAKGKLTRKAGG